MNDGAEFERHRGHLRALAYRMLGSRGDADDVVQDCWLRWREHAGGVEQPRAWLSRVATRLCLDRLQAAHARRETYTGVWLPEPLVDDAGEFDAGPEARIEYAQDVSLAFMLALERLTPLERAAFLLHDVFDLGFDEVALRLQRDAAACRKLATRARAHLQSAQARVDVDDETSRALLGAFAAAATSGDVERLASLLTADVVFLSDGGGKVAAVRRPLHGAALVARTIAGFARGIGRAALRIRPARINAMPGFVVSDAEGRVVQTLAFGLRAIDGGGFRIAAVYVVRNPDKLRHVPG